jgi:3'(2'), 5'-bisphosphate nucleotidase
MPFSPLDLEDVALISVRAAAHVCQHVRRTMDPATISKSDLSPVTVADFASQAVVCKILNDHSPGVSIVAEEGSAELRKRSNAPALRAVTEAVSALFGKLRQADVCDLIDLGSAEPAADRFWTLDPIDGTKGYLRGEQYAIALGLIERGQVTRAALACPSLALGGEALGVVAYAVLGKGAAWHALRADGPIEPHPMRVSEAAEPSEGRLCESVESGHSAHDESAALAERIGLMGEPVRLDSQAKYAVVAAGEAEVYLRMPTRRDYREKIWDHAAGALLVQEAGGLVTDLDGKPLDFSLGRELRGNRGILATNGLFHDLVLNAQHE